MFWPAHEVRQVLLRLGLKEEQVVELMKGFKREPGSGPERVKRFILLVKPAKGI